MREERIRSSGITEKEVKDVKEIKDVKERTATVHGCWLRDMLEA